MAKIIKRYSNREKWHIRQVYFLNFNFFAIGNLLKGENTAIHHFCADTKNIHGFHCPRLIPHKKFDS